MDLVLIGHLSTFSLILAGSAPLNILDDALAVF